MRRVIGAFERYLPVKFRTRRFLLEPYHFDLTSFEGDIEQWLTKFPITSENLEIYFALGELFRRRGEFDKAISLHEAISATNLEAVVTAELKIEIAQDYYAAGMLGHAEQVLVEALEVADEKTAKQAYRLWLTILESEQDWQRAIELVEKFGIPGSGGIRLSNLYCEYAQQLNRLASVSEMKKSLKKAKQVSDSARAKVDCALQCIGQGEPAAAYNLYLQVLTQNINRVNLVIDLLLPLVIQLNKTHEFILMLASLYARHPSVRLFEAVIELSQRCSFELSEDWQQVLDAQIKQGDSFIVMQYWLSRQSVLDDNVKANLESAFSHHSIDQSDQHSCVRCGFASDKMVWQCPQCNAWETIYSQYELKIEQKIKK